MTPWRVYTRRLSADLFAFGWMHSFLAFGLYAASGSTEPAWGLLAVLVPFGGMLALRERVDHLALFLPGHVALAALPLFLPLDPLSRGAGLLLLTAQAAYSLITRLRGDWAVDAGTLALALGTLVGLSLFAGGLKLTEILPAFSGWSFVMIICWLIHAHTGRLDDSLAVLKGSKQQPVDSILRFNNGIFTAFLALTAGAAFLSRFFPLGSVANALGRGLLAVLRWLAARIPWREGAPPEAVEELAEAAPPPMEIGEPVDRSAFWELLNRILEYAITVAAVLGLLAALVYGAWRFYRRFYASRGDDGDLRESIGPEERRERLDRVRRGLRERLPSFGRTERERLRRLYYRKVRRHIKRGVAVKGQNTPWEIAAAVRPKEDIDGLTARYEQARYGPQGPGR